MTPHTTARTVALAALLLLPLTARLHAQAEISIRTPEAWDAGRAVAVAEGDTLRVTGTAFHPGGVARVLVNGRDAELTRNPQFVNTVNFSAVLVAAAGLGRVTIRIEPGSGDPFVRDFGLEVRTAPAPAAALPPPAAAQAARGNPWRGMMLRGIGYGAIAGAGVYLGSRTTSDEVEVCEPVGIGQDCFRRITETASSKTLGLGLIAGAAAVTLIDIVATSRRASRAGQPAGRSDVRTGSGPAAPRFAGPVLDYQRGQLSASLIRVRF